MINHQNAVYNTRENCLRCTSRSPIFRFLKEEELSLLNSSRHEVVYNAGEIIFKQGSPLTHVLSFNYGLAKMQVEGPGTGRIILRLVKPVEFITGMGIFNDHRNQFSLVSLERSSVCYIGKEDFIEVIHNNREFREHFLMHIEHFQAVNLKKLLNLNQKNATGRMAEALLYLADEIYAIDSFDSHLGTQDLADLAGISKESAFKVLSEFSSQGTITKEGSVVSVLNKPLLEKISRNG